MATNITTEQRDGILKVIVGLFDAAPGGIYLNQFAGDIQGGVTNLQLADALANDPVFLNGVLGGKVTSVDKVNVLMEHYGLTADNDPASAGSQAKAYFESKLGAGQSMGQIVVDAGDYLSGTVAPEFQATKNLFLNKVAVAANYSLNSNATDLSTLQNSLSQVKGDHLYTAAEAQAIANEASANSFVLTADPDIIKGTAANDIITGTYANTMQAVDQIDGGSGFDTLKVLDTVVDNTRFPGIITGVEALQIAKLGGSLDLSAYTKAATGLTTVAVSDATGFAGTITTTAGQSLSLATANGAAAGAVTWTGSATDTSLNLTLNGYQGDEAATPLGLTVTGAAATTLNIASIGADNVLDSLVVNPVIKNVVITGDNKFTTSVDTSVLDKIDASANTAGVEIIAGVPAAAFAFTGGSGDDSLAVGVGGLGTITAGSQLDGGAGTDTLVTSETAVAPATAVLTAAQIAKINTVKGFEVLGFSGDNSGADVSAITNTGITQFKVNAGNLSETFTNALSSSNFVIDNSISNTGNVTIANKVGENATNITLDTGSATVAQALGTLTLSGVTNVVLTSTGSAANEITTFANSDNSVITIKGAAGLTLATQATSTGSKVDGSAATGDLEIAGNTAAYASGSSLGDILIGGSGDDILTASINNGTLTGNAGNDTFDVSAALGGVDSITAVTDFTKGDLVEFGTAATFTTTAVDLSTATTQAQALDLLAAGTAANALSWGVYGGNTYLVDNNDATVGFGVTDTAVKLTGTLDLSTSTLATDILTFA